MRLSSSLLALVPLLGLVELGLHQYFAGRAPGFEDYAALAPELIKAKRQGEPVVVAPGWAEPLLRQAAPAAFPITELARPDNDSYASFLEVSLLGSSAPELSGFPVRQRRRVGAFELLTHDNPKPDLTRFDFVSAVDVGSVEVALGDAVRKPCTLVKRSRGSAGGLHGHLAVPAARYECDQEHFVTVTLVEDQDYRPHRCILVSPPAVERVVLAFNGVTATSRLVGHAGYAYFLQRDERGAPVHLEVSEEGRLLGGHDATGAGGWSRFELQRGAPGGRIEVALSAAAEVRDFCFALEAR